MSALSVYVPPIEPVYAASASQAGLTVTLSSGGCTRKSDLTVAISKGQGRPLILIARKHPDACQSFAAGHVEVTWTWPELALKPGEPFTLGNPLTADPGP